METVSRGPLEGIVGQVWQAINDRDAETLTQLAQLCTVHDDSDVCG